MLGRPALRKRSGFAVVHLPRRPLQPAYARAFALRVDMQLLGDIVADSVAVGHFDMFKLWKAAENPFQTAYGSV
jgi:hypothetical protein